MKPSALGPVPASFLNSSTSDENSVRARSSAAPLIGLGAEAVVVAAHRFCPAISARRPKAGFGSHGSGSSLDLLLTFLLRAFLGQQLQPRGLVSRRLRLFASGDARTVLGQQRLAR